MLTHHRLLHYHNSILSTNYEGSAQDLDSALRTGLWYNSIACAEQEHVADPQPVLAHWQGMDNRDRYERNLADPATRKQLEVNGWADTRIDYYINRWGFRSDHEYEHIAEPCLVALGCSYTFGTGLHEHQVWASILAKRLGIRLVNLAVPGHGLDLSSLWLLLQGHNITQPHAVCVLEPPAGRISWMSLMNDTATSADVLKNIADKNIKMMSSMFLNSSAHTVKNYHIIKSWADSHGAPLLWDINMSNKSTTFARDLAHFGPEWQQHKADCFYSYLKNT
jgi:hypothetical protein